MKLLRKKKHLLLYALPFNITQHMALFPQPHIKILIIDNNFLVAQYIIVKLLNVFTTFERSQMSKNKNTY